MGDYIGAMRLLNDLDEKDVREACFRTIYNIFGFLDLDDKNTMVRSDLDRILKANIRSMRGED